MNVGANIVWAISETIVRMVVVFLVNALIARHLGPHGYGELTAAFIVVNWAMAFTALGLDTVVIREISSKEFKVSEIMGVAALFRAIAALCSSITVVVLVFWNGSEGGILQSDSMWTAVAIMSPLLLFQPISYTMSNSFSAFLRADILTGAKVSGLVLATGGRIMGLVYGLPLVFFAFCHLLEHLVATIVGCFGYFKNISKKIGVWKVRLGAAERLYKDGRWLFASACVVCIIQGAGVLLLRKFSSDFETGIYSAALRLAMVFQFVPAVLCKTFLPLLTSRRGKDEESNVAAIERELFKLLWLFGYSVAIFFLLFSDFLVPLIFGNEFKDATAPLKILAFTLIPLSIGAARGVYFAKDRSYKKLLAADSVGAAVTLIVGYMLIPSNGAVGAAAVTLISASIGYVLFPYLVLERGKQSSKEVLKAAVFPFPNFKVLFQAKLSS